MSYRGMKLHKKLQKNKKKPCDSFSIFSVDFNVIKRAEAV